MKKFVALVFATGVGAGEPRWEVDAAVVYWKANVNGLTVALDEGQGVQSGLRWGPGAQLGLGYVLPHDHWKLLLQGTVYRTHATEEFSGEALYPVWIVGEGVFTKAQEHYRLHLGEVDLGLQSPLGLAIGLSFLSLRQKYHLAYGEEDVIWRMKNKFWGVGPFLGYTGAWTLWRHLMLKGSGALYAFYGECYVHQGERVAGTKRVRLFDRFDAVDVGMKGSLGLCWRSSWWEVDVGYDQALFFAQNQLMHVQSQGQIIMNQGDLSLLGVHLGARFQF